MTQLERQLRRSALVLDRLLTGLLVAVAALWLLQNLGPDLQAVSRVWGSPAARYSDSQP